MLKVYQYIIFLYTIGERVKTYFMQSFEEKALLSCKCICCVNAVIIHFKDLKISIDGISEREKTKRYWYLHIFMSSEHKCRKNPQKKKKNRWVIMTLAKGEREERT